MLVPFPQAIEYVSLKIEYAIMPQGLAGAEGSRVAPVIEVVL